MFKSFSENCEYKSYKGNEDETMSLVFSKENRVSPNKLIMKNEMSPSAALLVTWGVSGILILKSVAKLIHYQLYQWT